VVFIGSALTVLTGAAMVLGAAFLANSSRMANQPPFLRYALFFEAALCFAFGGWGVASGVGLLQLKRWARISMVVYAVILLVCTLPAALTIGFVPLTNSTNNPNAPALVITFIRVGLVFFYGAFAALGGFWLYFFNMRTVKAQFRGEQPIETALVAPSQLAAGTPFGTPAATTRPRPLSISIIGWFLVVSCALMPLEILLLSVMFPHERFPFCIMGFFVFGRSAYLLMLGWAMVQLVAAAGLLKLKNWGRLTTIGLNFFGIANGALVLVVPGNRERFQQLMETMTASMNTTMPRPASFTFPAWIGLAFSLPFIAAILWFLFAEKQAFMPAAPEFAGQGS
jgi:hypothetical protein